MFTGMSSSGAASAAAGLVHSGGLAGIGSYMTDVVRLTMINVVGWQCVLDRSHFGLCCMCPVIQAHAIDWYSALRNWRQKLITFME